MLCFVTAIPAPEATYTPTSCNARDAGSTAARTNAPKRGVYCLALLAVCRHLCAENKLLLSFRMKHGLLRQNHIDSLRLDPYSPGLFPCITVYRRDAVGCLY